ncbi:MAG: TetR/AcrR family transcriptional regulator [Schwartzia sp.]|nr:TetR/AcrR family transcriptional regulator [Schwartzia sp. (in: firmicutes)]
MTRVRKEPEERRQELMNTALELFCEHGYTKTMVQDICQKAGVAKGTFFYYFPSKEDVLRAIVERWSNEFLSEYKRQIEKLDAIAGLNYFIEMFGKENPIDTLVDKLSEEKQYDVMQQLWSKCASERFNPVLAELFAQGVKEKSMKIEDSVQCLGFFWAILDAMYPTDCEEGFVYEHDEARDKIALRLFEALLGIKKGSLKLA